MVPSTHHADPIDRSPIARTFAAWPPSARRKIPPPSARCTKLSGAEVDAIDAEVDAINATRPIGRASRETVTALWLRERIEVERAKRAKKGGAA